MVNDPAVMERMLHDSQTIAVVGMSDKPQRPSYGIGKYLMATGYRVLPVNPQLKSIDGIPVFADLEAAQKTALAETGKGIDLVDVFRASEFVPPVVDEVIRLGIRYLWLQDGVVHNEAIGRAVAAGVVCVQDECIFREHARLAGDH